MQDGPEALEALNQKASSPLAQEFEDALETDMANPPRGLASRLLFSSNHSSATP
jgi:hypothetical protein